MLANIFRTPPEGLVVASNFRVGGTISVDVCIVTNCAFPGGNASTTITELEAFSAARLSCVIIHCPVKRSVWKRHWVAERFLAFLDQVVPAHAVKQIHCRTLIARGPRMAMTPTFRKIAKRISAERALYVVNNSAWSENGKPVFDWSALHERVAELGLPRSQIYPISPLIREEARKSIKAYSGPALLAARDWPPAFKVEDFPFRPKPQFKRPIVIGRHGRDHVGKWLEDPVELRAAFPDRPDIVVSIMGGAEVPKARLGTLPANWVVLPFGTTGVSDYLSQLDVFVNFIARSRDEAFGRTIIEAVLCGVPTVLPPAFETTFGELALYCEPGEVAGLIERLAADNRGRLHFVEACRKEAAERFGAHTLRKRLEAEPDASAYLPQLDEEARAFRRRIMG
jgi:glycosyltransferase involved in cell wall biosynthesis